MSYDGLIVLAHGVGGRRDLPIPFNLAILGGGLAVAVSFLGFSVLWRKPRFRGAEGGTPLPLPLQRFVDDRKFRSVLRVIGLAITVFLAVAAVFGKDDVNHNPTAVFVYAVFWVGIVPASLLLGPVWRLLNPLRTLAGVMLRAFPEQRRFRVLPEWLGYWPAAAGLVAFTWLELVPQSRTSTTTLLIWFGLYGAINLVAAGIFGMRWFDQGDGFEVFSTVIGKLAPVGRRDDGQLVLRNPFDGLDALRPASGMVALVGVMFGSTLFDGLSHAQFWVGIKQTSSLPHEVTDTVGLFGTITLISVLYVAAIGVSSALGLIDDVGLGARQFAHSIVPIAVGYSIAHYCSLLVFESQHAIILASDPLGRGQNLFGTTHGTVNYDLFVPAAIAFVQVAGVVIGHVLGVVAAHDRAIRLYGWREGTMIQVPLVILMINYTGAGLYLLLSG